MTSTFDTLAGMGYRLRNGELSEDQKKTFHSIIEEAVCQINKRKPTKWNFELWLSRYSRTEREMDHFFGYAKSSKLEFIDDTHSALDHTDTWHLKIFNRAFLKNLDKFNRELKGWKY